MDKKELLARIEKDQVKFISFQFTDVTGTVKSLDTPVRILEESFDGGIWFDKLVAGSVSAAKVLLTP